MWNHIVGCVSASRDPGRAGSSGRLDPDLESAADLGLGTTHGGMRKVTLSDLLASRGTELRHSARRSVSPKLERHGRVGSPAAAA